MKVTVRDFDPIRDANPVFNIEIANIKIGVFLSDIKV